MFIGRENELKELKNSFSSNKFESIIIYGRRRVGKTEIIKESIKNYKNPIVHYECKRTSLASNLNYLTQCFTASLGFNNKIKFESYNDFFNYVFQYSVNQEFILIIDEFSFLLEEDFSIESVLAACIDIYKNISKLKLIISGSYVTIMQKMIEYGSHSYGRFNHVLLIRPFDYFTSSLFYENYSNEDKIKTYSVFGGLPYFNSLIDSNLSVEENIFNLIIKKDSILEHELNEMILYETKRVAYLNDLISIIGQGTYKYKDIVTKIKQNKDARPDYLLNKLIEMDILKKVVPINDKTNTKKTLYKFQDNLIHFYYKYIFNSPFSINRENPKFYYDNFIKEDFLNQYIPEKFEKIATEFLIKANINNKIQPIIMEIGTYSFNDKKNKINREFDVVTLDKNGYISYECKYTSSKIDSNIILEEENQTKELDINFYKLGFIAKIGFSNKIDKTKYNCFTLEDFYNFSN